MMVGRNLLLQVDIDGFQLIFAALLILRVVPFPLRQNREAKHENDLQELPAIVLKDVLDAVFRRQLLILPNGGKKLVQNLHVGVRLHLRHPFEKLGGLHFQCPRNFINIINGNIDLSSFNRTYIGAMQPCFVRQLLLA